jgi:hypothetical protein
LFACLGERRGTHSRGIQSRMKERIRRLSTRPPCGSHILARRCTVHDSQEDNAIVEVASASFHGAASHLGLRFNKLPGLPQESLDVVDNLLLAAAAWARNTRLCARLWIGGNISGVSPSDNSKDGKAKEEAKKVGTESCTSA